MTPVHGILSYCTLSFLNNPKGIRKFMVDFAHLHVHTEYSLLDGMCKLPELVSHVKSLGMNALAITDHGTMYGAMDFYRECIKQNVKPIIGLEAYISPRRMTERDPQLDKNNNHLLLLAQNQQGYKNLLKIASASQLEGFYYKPRIDHEFLASHSEGLITTTGCLAAEIPQLIMNGQEEQARKTLSWYLDVFGPDRFFVELQDHAIPELREVNQFLLQELGPYANLSFLATNDVHYIQREDANPHDVLLCIGTGSQLTDQNRFKFSGDSYYVRSPREMVEIFGEIPGALTNSIHIAEMCDLSLDDNEYKLPIFPVPGGRPAQDYLRELVERGLRWRYEDRSETAEVQTRMEYELEVIHDMGFDNYFLIVWDLCEFSRANDIWWNVRGSGAGSLVAYCLGITSIDPLENHLIFERFLNPGRKSMPDIDLDYPDDRRAEMITYCAEKYGNDKVAAIITFGTLGARAVIRDVARTMNVNLSDVDELANTIPNVPGKAVTLDMMIEDNSEDSEWKANYYEFRGIYNDPARPYFRQVVDTARKLEGIARHASTHAAGIIVSDKPLDEYIPLHRPTKGTDEESGIAAVSQWPMAIVESIGLLKVDFLGLRTLTIMRKACELIERYHGLKYDLTNIPYRAKHGEEEQNAQLERAFQLLWNGETSGIFQVEGAGMTRMLMQMKPSRFEHIVAAISLFRPGPMEYIQSYIARMHGLEQVAYHHPLIKPILEETFGIIVYQEQIMQIASQLFGYSLGDADLMRRAVSKKKAADLEKHKAAFIENGPKNNIDPEIAEKIFADIEYFARYGFNKSHAADYAVLTMQTAFLKAHYQPEYMAALLSVEHGNSDKVRAYISECRRQNITILPPDINKSEMEFIIEPTAEGGLGIRYGLSAIKNVGEGAINEIVQKRGDEPYVDLHDFCTRADLRLVGKRALECLIKAGAMDGFAPTRMHLVESLDRIMGYSTSHHKASEAGQMSLFGEVTGVVVESQSHDLLVTEPIGDISFREIRQWEQELVGMYVSTHPLQKEFDAVQSVVTHYSAHITEEDNEKPARMAGMVVTVQPHMTRNGNQMGFAEIEDLFGTFSVLIWPSTWEKTRDIWEPGQLVIVTGKLDATRQPAKLLVDDVRTELTALLADTEDLTNLSVPFFDELNNDIAQSGEASGQFSSSWQNQPEMAPYSIGDEMFAEEWAQDEVSPPEVIPADLPTGEENYGNPVMPLQIYLTRSDDELRDKRLVGKIFNVLYSCPGRDPFNIILIDNESETILEFDQLTDRIKAVERLSSAFEPGLIEIVDD